MRATWLIRTPLASLVVVVVVCAAFQPSPVTASDESAAAADNGTITTTLYPGWNMVGWVGPATPASELFDELPALGRIFAWHGEEQRYRQLMPSGGSAGDQHLLAPGDGLWLYIGGTSTVAWTREASEDSVLLDLRAGRNLVAWAGRDGTPIEEATVRFGEALVSAWRWDAGAQEYRLFAPTAGLDQVQELNHGDALLVELSSGGRWWQSGTAAPPVEFLGEVPDERREEIRALVDSVRAVFAERWGVEAAPAIYVGDLESITPTYRRIRDHEPAIEHCGDHAAQVIFLRDYCLTDESIAHEYFHSVQDHLSAGHTDAPVWIIEGAAVYADAVFAGLRAPAASVRSQIDEYVDREARRLTLHAPLSLDEAAAHEDFHGLSGNLGYPLALLAADWLVRESSEESLVGFFEKLTGPQRWQDVFEGAFGLPIRDFYAEFEAYLAEIAPPLPHLVDDRAEPVLVFVGDVPSEMEAAVRAESDAVQRRFRELGAGTADYTLYVGADRDGLMDTYRRLFGTDPPERFCDHSSRPGVTVISLECISTAPYRLDVHHSAEIRERLAPGESLPDMPDGFDRWGPVWLSQGAYWYVPHAYRVARGYEDLATSRSQYTAQATQTTRSLSKISTAAGFSEDSRRENSPGSQALGFLAVEFMAELAGEAALFDYYRRLPDAESWEEAFEGAVGMAVDEFYEAFEVYRATAFVPSFPHMADDRNEPVLVFVGDIAAHTRQAVSDEFASLQAFFSEHFGTGTADYTLYIAADDEAVGEPYLLVHGRELIGDFCSSAYGIAAIVDVSCYTREGLSGAIAQSHMLAVRDRLAAVSPPLRLRELGLDFGPNWLNVATPWYGSFVYAEAVGLADYEVLHQSQVSRARQVARPLSSMATRAGFSGDDYWNARGVAILAVDWLADRAGDPAIFDYYRLLPDSETWEDAFEAAFGIAVDDFYEQFEAYRAEVAPPNEGADSS